LPTPQHGPPAQGLIPFLLVLSVFPLGSSLLLAWTILRTLRALFKNTRTVCGPPAYIMFCGPDTLPVGFFGLDYSQAHASATDYNQWATGGSGSGTTTISPTITTATTTTTATHTVSVIYPFRFIIDAQLMQCSLGDTI